MDRGGEGEGEVGRGVGVEGLEGEEGGEGFRESLSGCEGKEWQDYGPQKLISASRVMEGLDEDIEGQSRLERWPLSSLPASIISCTSASSRKQYLAIEFADALQQCQLQRLPRLRLPADWKQQHLLARDQKTT